MASGDGHKKANRVGKCLENEVEEIINSYGIESLFYSQIKKNFGKKIIKESPGGFLLKQVPYINMYGANARGEFVLQINNYGPVRIECRGQQVHGSVDEKFPFLIGNCYAFEEKHVVLIIEGNGARKSAIEFVKNAARALAYKDIKVLNLKQFRSWAKQMLGSKDCKSSYTEDALKQLKSMVV